MTVVVFTPELQARIDTAVEERRRWRAEAMAAGWPEIEYNVLIGWARGCMGRIIEITPAYIVVKRVGYEPTLIWRFSYVPMIEAEPCEEIVAASDPVPAPMPPEKPKRLVVPPSAKLPPPPPVEQTQRSLF